MLLTHLALSNVRNYAELDLEPAPGLNVFVGANAQGKSNLLEAIAMLGTGKSFRTNRDADVVREGMELAVVRGEAGVRAGSVNLACIVTKGARGTRKTYTVNGHGVRYSNFLGKIRVVTFVPSDLQLATGAPSLRRGFLNVALAQDDPQYYRDLARYRIALQQKNALLRDPAATDPELLAIYEQTLVEAGTRLMLARNHFMAAIALEARAAHARFTGGSERFDVTYEPNVAFETPTADAVAAALTARLRAVADSERARRSAVTGPHRDDLKFTLDGHSLEAYGSQGQQRTAVLALKVAEYAVMRERASESPLLLLDDVLSELDEERAAAFLAGVGDYEQAFVTATHLPAGLPARAQMYVVRDAHVAAGGGVLKLSDAISKWSPQAGRAGEDPMMLLGAVWPELVGEDVARNSHPQRVQDGTLTIVTRSSAWSQELTYLSERIVSAVGARLPSAAIARLRFRVGKLPSPQEAPGAPARASRKREATLPAASASKEEALGRLREGVTRRQRAKLTAGWKVCGGCGALVAPDGAALCVACVNARTQARTEATVRLLFEAPWLGFRGTAALVEGLTTPEYGSIRRRLLARWWGMLERARLGKRLSRDGRERAIASSYVVLKSELPPDEIRPATVRNVLGDELHDFLFGTEHTSETNGQ